MDVSFTLTPAIAAWASALCLVSLRLRLRSSYLRAASAPKPIPTSGDTLKIKMDEGTYIELLDKMISETKYLQNSPPTLIPEEDRVVRHVVKALEPYTVANGGPLEVEVISFIPGRSNVIVRYPGSGDYTVALVGSHMDVVPAVPENWERDPFKLIIEGDRLYGRGTTDCLGHVALITCLFQELAKKKPELDCNVAAVFICNEENDAVKGIGIDGLMANGHLDMLKNGCLLWVDASDSEPCLGTAGVIPWELLITGKGFHSGLPHNAINPIELSGEVVGHIQDRFYADFKAHHLEKLYHFITPSTMKPTQLHSSVSSLNQIPGSVTVGGDIRATPFYDCRTMMRAVEGYVADANANIEKFGTHGPVSKYTLPKQGLMGKIQLTWLDDDELTPGVACDIESPALHALQNSIHHVRGAVNPYSIGGSLPLVGDLREAGYDLQITGFGLSGCYHADNEYALLSDLKDGMLILSEWISRMETRQQGKGKGKK